MAEVIYPSPSEIEIFMFDIGYSIPSNSIQEVYPGYFPQRRVFRVDDRVYKIRKNDDAAQREVLNLQMLIEYYRQLDLTLQDVEIISQADAPWFVFTMPCFGININSLANDLSIQEYEGSKASDGFSGFSKDQIIDLVRFLGKDQVEIIRQKNLIHGDIFQRNSPNNVVYHPYLNRLLLVDAEALAPMTKERSRNFGNQVDKLKQWMLSTLVPSEVF